MHLLFHGPRANKHNCADCLFMALSTLGASLYGLPSICKILESTRKFLNFCPLYPPQHLSMSYHRAVLLRTIRYMCIVALCGFMNNILLMLKFLHHKKTCLNSRIVIQFSHRFENVVSNCVLSCTKLIVRA